ncbi:MAG: glycosyltransferase family 9 protein [Xanthobacteraceae bacterium]|uniref:glycosyltransferase family 9 protein n=1 Tax=Pseudolabrys sp. TaxID=1960880 RepID=UPI003D0C9B59
MTDQAPPALARAPRRVLVITLARIGDALLTTPLIRSLRRAWPDATIDVLTFKGSAAMFRGNPDIAGILTLPGKPSAADSLRLAVRLWRHYDLAISTQSGDRPTFYAALAAPYRAGVVAPGVRTVSDTIKRWLLQRAVVTDDTRHRVDQALQLADALGVPRVPELVAPAGDPATPKPAAPYAVIHAAPMFRYKQWTKDGWRALAAHLAKRGVGLVAIGSPDPAEQAYLRDVWDGVTTVQIAAWPATTALLQAASVYVGPDTSVTHLAAATGCPTVALFGPMDPRLWGPWPAGGMTKPWQASGTIQHQGNVWIVQNPLPCLPCGYEGCERHVASHSQCLDELAPTQVIRAVDDALAAA